MANLVLPPPFGVTLSLCVLCARRLFLFGFTPPQRLSQGPVLFGRRVGVDSITVVALYRGCYVIGFNSSIHIVHRFCPIITCQLDSFRRRSGISIFFYSHSCACIIAFGDNSITTIYSDNTCRIFARYRTGIIF